MKLYEESDLVLPSVDDRDSASKRRLEVVVHVLGRSGRDQVKHVVPRAVGVRDHLAVTVRPQKPPGAGPALEVPVLQQVARRARRRSYNFV